MLTSHIADSVATGVVACRLMSSTSSGCGCGAKRKSASRCWAIAGAGLRACLKRTNPKDPAPLKLKEVWVESRRYVVCLNEEERRKDAHDREAIVAHLRQQ